MKQWLRFPTKDVQGAESNIYLHLDPDVDLKRIEPIFETVTSPMGAITPDQCLVTYHPSDTELDNWDTLVASMSPSDLVSLLIRETHSQDAQIGLDEPVKIHIKEAIENDQDVAKLVRRVQDERTMHGDDVRVMGNETKVVYTNPLQVWVGLSFRALAQDLFVKWGRRRSTGTAEEDLDDTQDMLAMLTAWWIKKICRFCAKGDVPHPGDRFALHSKRMSEDGYSEPPCISSSIWMGMEEDDLNLVAAYVATVKP